MSLIFYSTFYFCINIYYLFIFNFYFLFISEKNMYLFIYFFIF